MAEALVLWENKRRIKRIDDVIEEYSYQEYIAPWRFQDCLSRWENVARGPVYYGPAVFEKALVTPLCDVMMRANTSNVLPELKVPVWLTTASKKVREVYISITALSFNFGVRFCEAHGALYGLSGADCHIIEQHAISSASRFPAYWLLAPLHTHVLSFTVFARILQKCSLLGLAFRPAFPADAYRKVAAAATFFCSFAEMQTMPACAGTKSGALAQPYNEAHLQIALERVGRTKEDAAIVAATWCVIRNIDGGQCFRVFEHVDGIRQRAPSVPMIVSVAAKVSSGYFAWASECFGKTAHTLLAVTAADTKYFDRLRNLIGSIHVWEPSMCIEVYDLGLSPRELQLLGKFARVHVRQLRWDALPSHLRDINMFAWKPLAMYDSIRRLRSFQMINWESDGLTRKVWYVLH